MLHVYPRLRIVVERSDGSAVAVLPVPHAATVAHGVTLALQTWGETPGAFRSVVVLDEVRDLGHLALDPGFPTLLRALDSGKPRDAAYAEWLGVDEVRITTSV